MTLGEYIDNQLIELNKDKKWLADKMNVSQATVTYWVQNKNKPTENRLPTLSNLLRVELSELLEVYEAEDGNEGKNNIRIIKDFETKFDYKHIFFDFKPFSQIPIFESTSEALKFFENIISETGEETYFYTDSFIEKYQNQINVKYIEEYKRQRDLLIENLTLIDLENFSLVLLFDTLNGIGLKINNLNNFVEYAFCLGDIYVELEDLLENEV